ncbi:MAG: DoxX family protein [Thermoanaerobaculia bacterium]
MKLSEFVLGLDARMARVLAPLADAVLLVLRLTWGWQFFQTGLGKLQNIDRVISFFRSLGIPAPGLNAYFVGTLELAGGLLLLVGLFARPVALLLTGNMLVAYFAGDRVALLGVFSNLEAFQRADPFMFLLVSVIVLTFGAGTVSLDRVLRNVQAADPAPP